jgi:hopene-associated glycosyltransferase HpnB
VTGLAILSLAAWLYLHFFHGRFWRCDQRLPSSSPTPAAWPGVVAIIPARDEAPFVRAAVRSLVRQRYPGFLHIVVVDDRSTDGTADAARKGAADLGAAERMTVIEAPPLEPGWTGKLWAVNAGLAEAVSHDPGYLLLADADIAHAPDALGRLVALAEAKRLDLASLMVKLRCESIWERLLIPAFVFFFQKLYPFPRVNDPKGRTAGAAGGCMLVRRAALDRIGGVAAIKGELIDDCALAKALKKNGPIWLGLAEDSLSLRPYDGLGGLWRMVARTAFTQLRHSSLLLLGTLVGMGVLYVVPPLATVLGLATGSAAALPGLAAWFLMARCYGPTIALYRRPPPAAVLLPVAAFFYVLMTFDSARAHWLGRGGAWKGRTY